MADPVTQNLNNYPFDYNVSKESSSEKSGESPSTPRMKQEKNSSNTSSVSAYPRNIRNIEHDVNEGIAYTRELNAGKEELWAKFAENTEVTAVTKLESLSSSQLCELSKWIREKAKPQITTLSISHSEIDDKAAIALAKVIKPQSNLNKLTTLQIGHKLSKLATLELVGNTISVEGCKTLAKAISANHTSTTLKIELQGNKNSDECIQILANALKTNRSITKLTICAGEKIGSETVDAIAQMVGTNVTYKELYFMGFRMRQEESKPISDASRANLKSKIESLVFN